MNESLPMEIFIDTLKQVFIRIGEMKSEIEWLHKTIKEERDMRSDVKFLAELHNFIPS